MIVYLSAPYRGNGGGRHEIEDFVNAIRGLTSEDDYDALLDRFAVRRTSPDFWQHSDIVHEVYRESQPIRWGWLDYSRLDNR